MKQRDVYWYTFRAPDKRRPVLILTRSSAIPYLTGITVAQITTTIRKMASLIDRADKNMYAAKRRGTNRGFSGLNVPDMSQSAAVG